MLGRTSGAKRANQRAKRDSQGGTVPRQRRPKGHPPLNAAWIFPVADGMLASSMSLRTITNHYHDFEVVDLDPSRDRGPFVVVQEGCAPGEMTATSKVFVLRRDGSWADAAYYLAGKGRTQLTEIMFEDTREVMKLLQQLAPRPVVANVAASRQEIEEWHRANPQIEPGLNGLRLWAVEFRRRQREGSRAGRAPGHRGGLGAQASL